MAFELSIDKIHTLQKEINNLNPVDLAEKFEELSEKDIAMWIKLLNKDLLADAFALLSKNKKIQIIESLSDASIISLTEELDEDELVDTLQELPANMVRKFMNYYIDDDRRPIINKLLGYAENSVGSVMSVNFLSVKINTLPAEIIKKIMNSDLDADRLEQVWVTDQSLVLVGYLYLADIMRHKGEDIKNYLKPIAAKVYATDDQEMVAKLTQKYVLGELPVTDSEGRLVGIIPAEWALDIMREEYEEDLANIHGITDSSSENYFEKSSFQVAKDRTMWLVICLVTATFTGFIIRRYEKMLSASAILTAYIPMLMDSGGNAGSQSSTTIITSLYAGEISFRDSLKVIFKEFKIAIFSSLALSFINIVRMTVIDHATITITLIVSITLVITIVLSKIIGGILPLIADVIKVDPTIMAGPLITTIVDTVVLLIYFETASVFLSL